MHRCSLSILGLLALLVGTSRGAGNDLKTVGEQVAILEDRRINESSGLALGIRDPSILWTINDSGGEPCVFAVDHAGRTRAKVRIPGAANFDWEDLAAARDASGQPALFIGDIGDNLHMRPTVQVYQIPEPSVSTPGEDGHETESAEPLVWHFTYPNGPLNAEALLVHPVTRRLFIVTKDEEGGSALYAAPELLRQRAVLTLEKVLDLRFPSRARLGKRPKDASQITAGSISGDARRLILSSYTYFYEWALAPGQSLAEALARPPSVIKPKLLAQLEAICYGADSRTLWFTSERLPAPLCRITRDR